MSRTPWWTTLTADNILGLRRRLLNVLRGRFDRDLGPEVEDVVQHAFIALFRDRENVSAENDGLFRYLVVAGRRAALDRVRRQKTRRAHRARIPPRAPGDVSPADLAQERENAALIRQFFCELDELERLVLWSRVVEGRSVRAIALALDLNWHRVADILDRVLRRLRRRLKEDHGAREVNCDDQ